MAVFSALATFVATSLFSIGVGAAASVAIGATVARLALSLAVTAISRALAPKPEIPKQDLQATISQEAGARSRLYGQGLLGGTRAFWESKDGELYMILILNHGALSDRLSFRFGGKVVSLAAENGGWLVDSGQGKDLVFLEYRDGTGTRGNYSKVTLAFPDLWTSDHRLEGQATLFARYTAPSGVQFNRAFPQGHNTTIQLEALGAQVLDVRTDQTGYSDNAGLCIHDYLASADGYGIQLSRLDAASFSAFADLSDEAVPLKDGGTEQRYRLWGAHSLTEAPKSVLQRMSLACDAHVYQTAEGKVALLGGRYSAPDVTLTDDDIYSLEQVEGDSAMDGFNVLKGIFTSAAHDYQDTEVEAWENTASLAANPEKSEEMQADMAPSHSQMRRLMKIQMGRLNRRWTGRLTTNLVGIKARFPKGDGIHTIRLQYSELGIDEPVEVLGHTIVAEKAEGGALIWKCHIDVASVDASDFDWDPDTEEGAAPPLPEGAEEDVTPNAVISQLSEVVDGTLRYLRVEIADTGRRDLEMEAQFKKDGVAGWQPMVVTGLIAESGSVLPSTDYLVRARYSGGDWDQSQTIQTSA